MVEQELIRTADTAEAACVEAMHAVAGDRTRETLGMSHTRIGGAVVAVMADDPTHGRWNRAVGLGVDEPLTGSVLDEVLAFAGHAPSLSVPVPPRADPDGLLEARGLTPEDTSVRFLVPGGFTAGVETTLHLEQVGPDIGRPFARARCAGSGLPEDSPLGGWIADCMSAPGMTSYAAFDGWKIVATASLLVRDGVAWLSGAATLPEERGRGAHSALVARRIFDANALGVRWIGAAVETGAHQAALRNLRRLGLTEVDQRHNWVWRP